MTKRRRGYTLVELLVVLALTALFFMASIVVFNAAEGAFISSLTTTPLAATRSALTGVLRDRVDQAACLISPPVGSWGTSLSGNTRTSCAGADLTPDLPGAPSFFKFCLDPQGQSRRLLLFTSPTAAGLPASCSGPSASMIGSPLTDIVGTGPGGNAFFRETANSVRVSVNLEVPLSADQLTRWGVTENSQDWSLVVTGGMPLSDPAAP